MKKLLITGFEPFDGEKTNPSWDAVAMLPEKIGGYTLTKMCVPVVFGEAAREVISKAQELDPDAILCIGQAGGRAAITPELVGINLRHARIPDNNGNHPIDEEIICGGDAAYFSTLSVRRIAEAIKAQGIPAELSYSAGAYVCNDLLYTLLHEYKNSTTRVAFIHVPYSSDQSKEPSMSISDIIKGLVIAVENLD